MKFFAMNVVSAVLFLGSISNAQTAPEVAKNNCGIETPYGLLGSFTRNFDESCTIRDPMILVNGTNSAPIGSKNVICRIYGLGAAMAVQTDSLPATSGQTPIVTFDDNGGTEVKREGGAFYKSVTCRKAWPVNRQVLSPLGM